MKAKQPGWEKTIMDWFDPAQNLLPFGGEVYYFSKMFSRNDSEEYFNRLFAEINWKQEPIKIFGKEIMQPRLTAWYGDEERSYTYSGLTMQANLWNEPLLRIKQVADEYGGYVSTSALLNLYRDGNDGMGWHRDNEKMLGKEPVIVSISFGEARTFQLRNYIDKKPVISIELEPGSLLIMKGESQKVWEHRVAKTNKPLGARINLTFRKID